VLLYSSARIAACVVAALLVGVAQSGAQDAGLGGRVGDRDSKLDPAVRVAIDSGRNVRVILLGRTQLFAPVGGFRAFQLRHESAKRLELRDEVIRQLKVNSEVEQKRILSALALPAAERSLWIMNALVVTLTPADVRRAATLGDVLFIYPGWEERIVPRQRSGAGMAILPSLPPRPFTIAGKRIPWNVEKVGAPRVWRELGTIGAGVIVASIDVGTNYFHQDLRRNHWVNAKEVPGNGVDDDGNGYVDDVYGYNFTGMHPDVRDTATVGNRHGTMTSGIIAGDGSGGIVTGVAPGARLMTLVASGITNAALAYQYALENGADVMSMSFSVPDLGNRRGLWRMMSEHAIAAGMVLVGGAGNFRISSQLPYQHQSPKDVPGVISMGGVDSTMGIVLFSSGGPAEWGTVAIYGDYPLPAGLIKPDLVAFPGWGYPVLTAAGDSGYVDPNNRIRGNSLSGPQGAGVAALMFSVAPQLPAWKVKDILERTARDLGPPGKDNDFGAGLLDAFAAVSAARKP
jgi:subtilisin family serine protease